jgi:hypothetical protein
MTGSTASPPRIHRHTPVTSYALRQQAGIPYEVARTVCTGCGRLLDERRLRRMAAA